MVLSLFLCREDRDNDPALSSSGVSFTRSYLSHHAGLRDLKHEHDSKQSAT